MSDVACLDSRRLIGPNIAWERPGALLEVAAPDADLDAPIERWREHARALLAALAWPHEDALRVRRYQGGALLIIAAPVNALYTATEVNEAAWALATDETRSFDDAVLALHAARDDEADPRALAIYEAARRQGKTCLVDEAGVSVGMGVCSLFWPPDRLPDPTTIDWSSVDDIPIALVTGTNGKTTTVRLLAALLRAAGKTAGLSSTDWIAVGDEVIDEGDYSGPGGARQVLRDARTEVAVLETARGGLLKRGIAVDRADVAVITNVTSDHLGEGGIVDLDALADVKFMVTDPLGDQGIAVINFDDSLCRARGSRLTRVAWFSLDRLPDGISEGGFSAAGQLWLRSEGRDRALMEIAAAPVTMGGHALHNVANTLAAITAASALGVADEALRQALTGFGKRPQDNPGRAQVIAVRGVDYLVDFAHNPDGMRAILATAEKLASGRLAVVFGQAGDRSDADIIDLALAVARARPGLCVVKSMDEHGRGRAPGAVAGIIETTLAEAGLESGRVCRVADDIEAIAAVQNWARAGDVTVMFVPVDRDRVVGHLTNLARE